MRRAGHVVAHTINALKSVVAPGITTEELDAVARTELTRQGAKPAFLGYHGFPATICVSVNEEIVHGIPGSRVLRSGDLLKLDVGAVVEGLFGDAAITLPVGDSTEDIDRLITTTKESLEEAIRMIRGGIRIGDIGATVQSYAESRGYSVVREYVGHGIGRALHEDPQVPNYGEAGKGQILHPGMVIAVEPMLNIGTWKTRVLEDNWTVVTDDGALSAHFEHSIAITEFGSEVLTRIP